MDICGQTAGSQGTIIWRIQYALRILFQQVLQTNCAGKAKLARTFKPFILIIILISPESMPYCAAWALEKESSKFFYRKCSTAASLTTKARWTSNGVFAIASSTKCSSATMTITSSSSAIVIWRSSLSSLGSSAISSSTTTQAPIASPTETKSSGPQGMNLAAPIARNLCGVGSFVAGGLLRYIIIYIDRRRTRKLL